MRCLQRVPLKAGESSVVTFSLGDEDFEWFDEQSNTVRPMNGDWQLIVGTSSADKDLKSIKINR